LARAWRLQACSAAAAAVFVSKHAPPPRPPLRPCHVTALNRRLCMSCLSWVDLISVRLECASQSRRGCCSQVLTIYSQVPTMYSQVPAARRCSRMQVLECSALQSIDDHHTKGSLPSLCVRSLLAARCSLHTHAPVLPACLPCPASPGLYLGPPYGRISVERCPLRAYPRRGAWSRRPSFTPSGPHSIILRHSCTRASGTFLKQTPPLRLLPCSSSKSARCRCLASLVGHISGLPALSDGAWRCGRVDSLLFA
jgi:hypothetical protein